MKNIASLTAAYEIAFCAYAADKTGSERLLLKMLVARYTLDLATNDCPRGRKIKMAQLKDCRKALAALEPKMSTFDIIGRILFAIIAAILLFSAGAGAVGIVMGAVPGGIILMAPAVVIGGLLLPDRADGAI